MRIAVGLLALVLALFASAPVLAEQVGTALAERSIDQQRKPVVVPRAAPKPVLGGYGLFDYEWMTAKDTFDAVFNTQKFRGVGAGAEVLNLWQGLFARVSFSRTSVTGSRADVVNGVPLSLGIPLRRKLMTVEFAGGWRIPVDRRRRYTAYGGAGVLLVTYRETSDFAGPGEDSRDTFKGYTAFGGIDAGIWKWIYAGAEAQYRRVPDALGDGGVSKEFGDTDLGGATIRILFGVRK